MRPPCSVYFTALSSRFESALTTWRRSHEQHGVGTVLHVELRDPAISAAGRKRSTASSTSARIGMRSRVGASWVSIRLRSSRSSTMRPSRSASFTIRSASGRVTAGSDSAAIVSASSSIAPIGVLSSWLTLATKSRRTLSMRLISEMSSTNTAAPPRARRRAGPTRRCSNDPRRAEELQVALGGDPAQRLGEQVVDRRRRPPRRSDARRGSARRPRCGTPRCRPGRRRRCPRSTPSSVSARRSRSASDASRSRCGLGHERIDLLGGDVAAAADSSRHRRLSRIAR